MANAGRVAIVPKGDYSSSTAYNRLDLVRYNEKAYVAKKANTGILPTNTEYWMLMTSDGITIDTAFSDTSTNPVQNKVVKTALDNIQTTSRATLSTAGWYRVAEFNGDTNAIKGRSANSCEILLRTGTTNNQPSTNKLFLTSKYGVQKFIPLLIDSYSDTNRSFNKIRYTYDNAKAYIEAYYIQNNSNPVQVEVQSPKAFDYTWQAITPTLTQETVDGVTVTTTYDIPANASPVTDLDLEKVSEEITKRPLAYKSALTQDALITIINDHSANFADGTSYEFYVNVRFAGYELSSGMWHITGLKVHSNNEVQMAYLYNRVVKIRGKDGGVWSSWETFATTADLANYFKNTGGEVTGNISVRTGGNSARVQVGSTARTVGIVVDTDGSAGLYDYTRGDWILKAPSTSVEGTFRGTATGNLPLNGGTVASNNYQPLGVKNTNADSSIFVRFENGDGIIGFLGVSAYGKPQFKNGEQSANYDLLHTGNSAKVAIQESAPTDTSALWVDKTNKKTKAYIDGAWTVIA